MVFVINRSYHDGNDRLLVREKADFTSHKNFHQMLKKPVKLAYQLAIN